MKILIYGSPDRRAYQTVPDIIKESYKKRAQLLNSLKNISFHSSFMTMEEKAKLDKVNKLISEVVSNYSASNTALGFKENLVCCVCGSPVDHIEKGLYLCEKCNK